MKRILLSIATVLLVSMSANAQVNNLLNKAAKMAGEKATEAATNAVKSRLGNNQQVSGKGGVGDIVDTPSATSDDQMPTLAELMAQMPALPTVAQLVDYKNAEANEMNLKMLTSPVTMFRTQMYTLSAQAMVLSFSDLDTNAIANMAMRYTGLTEAEIKAMEGMTEEQQEAFLSAYYQSGRADQAQQQAAERAEQYAKMIESQVAQYEAVDAKVQAVYDEAAKLMKPIYAAYATRIEKAEGKEYNRLMAEYYGKVCAMQHSAVVKAMKIRKTEQMPIVEQIERINEGIRKKDSSAVIPNYNSLFASAYFAEVEKLFSVPTSFPEE